MKNNKLNYVIEGYYTMFNVVETSTQQVIRTCPLYSDAKALLRHLNLGGGFDGWTPTFMLKNFSIPKEKVGAQV